MSRGRRMIKRMHKRYEERVSAGFTYVEVLVCMLIIASVIGPICMSFVASNKVRGTAQTLTESTVYTEALLERIKQQLTQDIKLKKQKDNHEILEYPVGGEARRSIEICLEEVYIDTTPLEKGLLSDFLWEQDFKALDKKVMDKRYGSERYAYEVAIWRTENIDRSKEALVFNKEALERAAKFYTHPIYCFNDYEVESRKISFEMGEALKTKFWKAQLAPREMDGLKVIGEHTITLSKEGIENISGKLNDSSGITGISSGEKIIMEEPKPVKNNKGLIGIIYTSIMGTDYKSDEMSIINVDIRQLLGRNGLETLEDNEKLTLTFVNQTQRNQVIRVIEGSQNNEDVKDGSLEHSNKKIEIVAVDKGIHSKTSIQYTKDIGFKDNFIIAIVTRDMKPMIGEAGKVVKQMIDVYSYE